MAYNPSRRTPEEEDRAIELVHQGKTFSEIAKLLKFRARAEFLDYRVKFPEFNEKIYRALNDYCEVLEERLLEIPLKYDCDTAKQLSTNIMQILKYRNPKRYGDKVNVDVAMTVDIAGSLERAERRVIDVGPVVHLISNRNGATTDSTDG